MDTLARACRARKAGNKKSGMLSQMERCYLSRIKTRPKGRKVKKWPFSLFSFLFDAPTCVAVTTTHKRTPVGVLVDLC